MVRKSPISGSWYAGTKESLVNQIEGLYKDSKFGKGELPTTSDENRVVGVISPHAGFIYSGYTATHSYHYLLSHLPKIDIAIILGPNHTGMGSEISLSREDWVTPLGDLQIDIDLITFAEKYNFDKLQAKFDELAHRQEHSIEIQLPFIQHLYSNLSFFPICISSQQEYKAIARFLFDIIKKFSDKKIAIICSSDLSHEYNYELLLENDKKMIELISQGDSNTADKFRRDNKMTMCGYGPIFALLELRKLMEGKNPIEFLSYSNSAMITNNFDPNQYRVAYSSFGIVLE